MDTETSRPLIGSEIDIRQLITEKAGFSTGKYHGFRELMDSVARRIGERLSLGKDAELSLEFADSEELRTDFIGRLQTGEIMLFRVLFDSMETPGIVVLPRTVFYKWFETALGAAVASDSVYPERDPTEIEQEAALLFCRRLCDALLKCLGSVGTQIAARIVPQREGENPGDWAHLGRQFAVFFDAALGDVSGEFSLVLPLRLIDPMRESVPEPKAKPQPKSDPGWESTLRSTVEHTNLKLRAVLGEIPSTLGAVMEMEVGQVIDLRQQVSRPIVIEANGNPLFQGFLGHASGSYMLKYDGLADKEKKSDAR